MRIAVDQGAIDPFMAVDGKLNRVGDLAMFPCAAQPVTYHAPVLFAARETRIVDDRHQGKGFTGRADIPFPLHRRAMQDQREDTAFPILLGEPSFHCLGEGLEQQRRHTV